MTVFRYLFPSFLVLVLFALFTFPAKGSECNFEELSNVLDSHRIELSKDYPDSSSIKHLSVRMESVFVAYYFTNQSHILVTKIVNCELIDSIKVNLDDQKIFSKDKIKQFNKFGLKT